MEKKSSRKLLIIFFLTAYSLVLSSCVRLTGGAGVWKQGAEDSTPTSHEVGFDTNEIVPQSNQAKIST